MRKVSVSSLFEDVQDVSFEKNGILKFGFSRIEVNQLQYPKSLDNFSENSP